MKAANPKMDKWLWSAIFIIVAGAASIHYCFQHVSPLLSVAGFLMVAGVVVWLFLKTTVGQKLWTQWLESVQEVRKMHWPTRQETLHTTGAVLLMVSVMGLLLCSADAVLLRAVKWLMTGHWGV